jgi:copper chaperone NosL
MKLLHLRLPAFICGFMFLAGCGDRDPIRPPTVFFGESVCDVCHMIVSDERFAAGIVVQEGGGGAGRYRHAVFDDIGCVFDFEEANPQAEIAAYYVRDYETKEWLKADEAVFVHSRSLHTPMAFGLAAVSTQERADGVQRRFPGDVIDLNEARARFARNELHVSTLQPVDEERGRTLHAPDGRIVTLELFMPHDVTPGRHPFEISAGVRGRDGSWLPLMNLEIEIEPDMPSMGHGSPGNEHPTHTTNPGHYAGLVNFTMRGEWVVHVRVRENGIEIGTTEFAFEVKR